MGDPTVRTTLALLEERLRRVDYLINGNTAPETPPPKDESRPPPSASVRLRQLERGLQSLASKSGAVAEVLALQQKQPQIFDSTAPSDTQSLAPSTLATIVLANTNLYTTASTALQQLASNDSVADAAYFAKLIALRPRIAAAQATQHEQAREVADLRARSARVMSTWYEDGVLGMGEKWAEWEESLRECEILVRRREARERREKEGVV